MSDFSISGKIEASQDMSANEFERAFLKELSSTFNKVKSNSTASGLLISGRVKPSVFNPIASFKGKLDIHIKNNQCRYIYDGKIGTNGWFWITSIIFLLLFFPLILVIAFVYHKQKKQIIEEMKKVEDRLKFSLEKF